MKVLPQLEGAERFRLVSKLGEGGMGVVYEAFDEDRGMPVALKTLRRINPTALYLFKQEFRSISGISHPNLVALYELFANNPENWFFTMQLLRGQGLLEFLRQDCYGPEFEHSSSDAIDLESPTSAPNNSPFDQPTSGHTSLTGAAVNGRSERRLLTKGSAPDSTLAREVMRQVVEGVAALHAAGKLHRDIKPTNVMVTSGHQAKVLDFGLAVDEFALKDSGTFHIVGTSAYMAPEQATGRPISPASDWYAVGVVLYQCLCGESPFQGSFRQATQAKLNRTFLRPSEVAEEVDPDLERLALALLEVEPSSRPQEANILAMLSNGATSGRGQLREVRVAVPFYGRSKEEALLNEAMDASLTGSVAFALVHGASGVGKSTLMQHYVQETTDRSLVLRGRCYEQESVPYKAIDSAVDALCQYLLTVPRRELAAMLPDDISLLAQLFPVLNRVNERVLFPAAGSGANDARRIRRRSVRAMRELLGALRRERPLILTIDDLQWGDVDSVLLLAEIFAPPDPPPVLVLCTYRREYRDRSPCLNALFELQKSNPTIKWIDIPVDPFSSEEMQDFAQSLLGDTPDVSDVASRIAKESGGNPYFAVELARYASRFSVHEARALGTDRLRFDNLLRDRIDDLSTDSRELLDVVAVHSQPIAQADAYHAAGLGTRDPTPLNALRLGNLVRSAGFNKEDQIESFHDRVRDAVLEVLSADRRRSLHQSLAETLEASGRGDAESLALHNQQAGNLVKAVHYHELAGDRAASALAFDRAAGHYRSCLELLAPGLREESALRAKLGETLVNSGRSVDAAREFEAAAHHAAGKAKVELERRAAFHYAASGHIKEGDAIYERVLARVGLKPATSQRSLLLSIVVLSLRLRMQGSRFRERNPETVPQIMLDRFDAAWSVAVPMSLTNAAQAMNFGLLALLIAMKVGDPVRFVYGLGYSYVLTLQGGEARRRATSLIEIGRAIVARQQDPTLDGVFAYSQAGVAYVQGHWKETLRLLDQAEEAFATRARGAYFYLAQIHTLQFYALWPMGEYAELARRSGPFLEEAEQLGDLFFAANIRSFSQPLVHLMADRPELAPASVVSGLKELPGYQLQNAMAALICAWIALYEGKAARNLDFVEQQWKLIRAHRIDSFDNMKAACHDFRLRTALAAAQSKHSSPQERRRAMAIAQNSYRMLEKHQHPWSRASATIARAAFEVVQGKRESAVQTLLAGANQFEELDMLGHAWSARRRAGEMTAGDSGGELVESADHWFRSQSIVCPKRFSAMLVGGYAEHDLSEEGS